MVELKITKWDQIRKLIHKFHKQKQNFISYPGVVFKLVLINAEKSYIAVKNGCTALVRT